MRHADPHRSGWPMCCLGFLVLLAGCRSAPRVELLPMARPFEIRQAQHVQACPPAALNAGQQGKPVPISLDTVLRLAQDQNGQVRLARMKLDDAATEHYWASKHWMPDLSVGIGAYRHDGGIQDFNGNLLNSHYGSALAGIELSGKYDWKEVLYRRVEAERRVWQQKGELSKLTSENLLEAATTYISLDRKSVV